MPFVATVSLTESDKQYLKDNNISLSQLVRENLKIRRETHSPEQVPTSKGGSYV